MTITRFERWKPGFYGGFWVPAKATGGWKIVTTEGYSPELYIEIKELFFKKWISEDHLRVRTVTTTTNRCANV